MNGDTRLRNWAVWMLQQRRRVRALADAGPAAPKAPTNLIGSDGANYIQLGWSDLSGNELGFRVYRNDNGAGYVLWRTLGANVVNTQDATVVVQHVYSYYVTAYNAVGESGPSNVYSETYGA